MKIFASILPLILLFAWPACESHSAAEIGAENINTTQATLRWTGMQAADGCGFFIEIDGTEYKPINDEDIPEKYAKFDKISKVMLTYQLLEEPQPYSCGLMAAAYNSNIRVIKVKSL